MGPKRGEFICPMAGLNTYVQLFTTLLEGSSISILNVALSITVPLHFYTTVHFHLCTSELYTLQPALCSSYFTIGTFSFPQHVAIARGNCTWQLGTCNCIFLPLHLAHVNYATLHSAHVHITPSPLCQCAAFVYLCDFATLQIYVCAPLYPCV